MAISIIIGNGLSSAIPEFLESLELDGIKQALNRRIAEVEQQPDIPKAIAGGFIPLSLDPVQMAENVSDHINTHRINQKVLKENLKNEFKGIWQEVDDLVHEFVGRSRSDNPESENLGTLKTRVEAFKERVRLFGIVSGQTSEPPQCDGKCDQCPTGTVLDNIMQSADKIPL